MKIIFGPLVISIYLSFVLFFFACQTNTEKSAKKKFSELNTETENIKDLNSLQVIAMLQDRKGLLWLGINTDINGLYTYDGYNTKVFRHNPFDPTSYHGKYIHTLYQDHQGRIWIGTVNEGLHVYYPQSGKFYKYLHDENNPHTISQNRIEKIWEDASHNIWLATQNKGINKVVFTRQKTVSGQDSLRFETYPITRHDGKGVYILDAKVSSVNKNIVWIGVGIGLVRLDMRNPGTFDKINIKQYSLEVPEHKTHQERIEGNAVMTILASEKNGDEVFWLGTKTGLKKAVFHRGKSKPTVTYIGYPKQDGKDQIVNFQQIYQSKKHYKHIVWLATNNGLFFLDKRRNKINHFETSFKKLNKLKIIYNFFEDKSGLFYINSDEGTIKLDFSEKKFNVFNHVQGVTGNARTFYETKDRHIWQGTHRDGLYVFNPSSPSSMDFKISNYLLTSQKGKEENMIDAISEDLYGNIWVGTDGGGTFKFHPDSIHIVKDTTVTDSVEKQKKHREDNQPLVMVLDSIKKYKRHWSSKSLTTISNNYISAIFCDKDTNVWLAGISEALNRYNKAEDNFIRYEKVKGIKGSLKDYIITKITQDYKGRLWLGTDGGGLYSFVPAPIHKSGSETFTMYTKKANNKNSLLNNNVNDLYEDPQHRLWIATGEGLSVYDLKKNKFRSFTKNHGLPIKNIQKIRADKTGDVWLAEENIFVHVDTKVLFTGKNPQNAFQRFELKENYFDFDKLFKIKQTKKKKKDKIVIKGSKNIIVFNPNMIQSNLAPPPILLTNLKVNHKSVGIGEEVEGAVLLENSLAFTEKIELNHLHQSISFEFSALHFHAPLKNQYMYKMEGFDKEWIYTSSKKRFANYTNLPVGKYTFRVRASNHDGIWNNKGLSLQIVIHPALWNTWLFKIVLFLWIALFIFLGIRWRVNILEKQKLKLERTVEKRTRELKEKNIEILGQTQELQNANVVLQVQQQEIAAQNEELFQQSEELTTQRDFLNQINTNLEKANVKVKSNEQALIQSNEQLKKNQQELVMKNRQINQSIHVALTIQKAIFPHEKKLNHLLKDYYILYRPKDVVSGDFYWLHQTNEGKTILFVGDCTGHGVPGAFMTLIGSNLLDKIVRERNITDPAKILTRMHQEVTGVLKQKYTKTNAGMDAVVINLENVEKGATKLTFAGAKNSVYYIKSGRQDKLLELKGIRRAIGGEQNEKISFTNQEVVLPSRTLIYMGSDGLADQNNIKRKKFSPEKLKKLLEDNAYLSLKEQEKVLKDALARHMKDTKQRDDILWIGFRV